MAQMPVEVVEIGDLTQFEIGRALALANSLQKEFVYYPLSERDSQELRNHVFQELDTAEFLTTMDECRARMAGYHPYLIAFVDAYLKGEDYENIFGSDRPEKGLAVFTTCGVPGRIIPAERILSYFIYYLAKATLCFLAPDKKNHQDTKRCVFDQKLKKKDIVESMRARAFCDSCRKDILNKRHVVSPHQLAAVDRLLACSGDVLEGRTSVRSLPRAFVGCSTEGLPVARKLQDMLKDDLATVIWDKSGVFGLSDTAIESLENAVLTYDYGLFVLTPDDRLVSRHSSRDIARDNVVFELGLFMGKLTRHRLLVVQAKGVAVPTDLSGFTTARYDPAEAELDKALEQTAHRIRAALGHVPLASG